MDLTLVCETTVRLEAHARYWRRLQRLRRLWRENDTAMSAGCHASHRRSYARFLAGRCETMCEHCTDELDRIDVLIIRVIDDGLLTASPADHKE